MIRIRSGTRYSLNINPASHNQLLRLQREMTDLVENSADLRVERLTKLLKHKETFQNAPLSAYLRDIGRLLEETHESRVKVTCHVTSTCYDLTVDGLPDISSHIKRYVKVSTEILSLNYPFCTILYIFVHFVHNPLTDPFSRWTLNL